MLNFCTIKKRFRGSVSMGQALVDVLAGVVCEYKRITRPAQIVHVFHCEQTNFFRQVLTLIALCQKNCDFINHDICCKVRGTR